MATLRRKDPIGTRSKAEDGNVRRRTFSRDGSIKQSPGMSTPKNSPLTKVVTPGGSGGSSGISSLRKRVSSDAGGGSTMSQTPPMKRRKKMDATEKESDPYCWMCHKEGQALLCELCPRAFHVKCLGLDKEPRGDWVCPECETIMKAECTDTRSKAMSMVTIDQLCILLKFGLQRMKHVGSEPFQKPVDLSQHPQYKDFIINPMDLSLIENNIKKKMYGCTEAFMADARYILHNCIVFNGTHHKLTASAKMVIKIGKHEMSEIELCPDCYYNSCTKTSDFWFCEPCRNPHPVVWAKLKGYPFWPAKVLREVDGQVDVRFFGAHDRAWLGVNQVYMLSAENPTIVKNMKKGGYDHSMKELDVHIEKLRKKYSTFTYAPPKTPFNMNDSYQQKTDDEDNDTKNKNNSNDDSTKTDALTFNKTPLSHKIASKHRGVRSPAETITTKTASAVKSKYRQTAMATRRAGKSPMITSPNKTQTITKVKQKVYDTNEKDENITEKDEMSEDNEGDDPTESETVVKQEEDDDDGGDANASAANDESSNFHDEHDSGNKAADDIETMNSAVQSEGSVVEQAEEDGSVADDERIDETKTIGDKSEKSASHEKEEESEGIDNETTPKDSTENTSAVDAVEDDDENDDDDAMNNVEEDSDDNDDNEEHNEEAEKKLTVEEYQEKLKKTIENCKEKLGIVGEQGEEPNLSSDTSSSSLSSSEDEDATNSKKNDAKITGETADNEMEMDSHKDDKLEPEKMETETTTKEEKVASSSQNKQKSMKDVIIVLEDCVKESERRLRDNSSEAVAMETESENVQKVAENAVDDSSDGEKLVIDLGEKNVKQKKAEEPSAAISPPASLIQRQREALAAELKACEETRLKNKEMAMLKAKQAAAETTKLKQQETSKLKEVKQMANENVQQTANENVKLTANENVKQTANVNVPVGNSASQVTPTMPATSSASSSKPAVRLPTANQITESLIAEAVTSEMPSGVSLEKYMKKITDVIKASFQEMYQDLLQSQKDMEVIKKFQEELDQLKWLHQQQLSEIRHNTELTLAEMRQSFEADRHTALSQLRNSLEVEAAKAVAEAKKKQWCANCGKEAIFYCCWNTSYCDYPCQQQHWSKHMGTCTQAATESDQQQHQQIAQQPQQQLSVQQPATTTLVPSSTITQQPIQATILNGPDKPSDGAIQIIGQPRPPMPPQVPYGGRPLPPSFPPPMPNFRFPPPPHHTPDQVIGNQVIQYVPQLITTSNSNQTMQTAVSLPSTNAQRVPLIIQQPQQNVMSTLLRQPVNVSSPNRLIFLPNQQSIAPANTTIVRPNGNIF